MKIDGRPGGQDVVLIALQYSDMPFESIKKFQPEPGAVGMDFGWANVTLYPSAPYSIRSQSSGYVLGLAFERQRGVHAIGGERRQDFDAWPGELACASPELNIFSESMQGGEYLALHVARAASAAMADTRLAAPRVVFHGDRHAVRLGWRLRRLLLAAPAAPRLVEEQIALFLERGLALAQLPARPAGRYDLDRAVHARVLDYIDDGMDGPLGLDELARLAGMPPLRFLRSFANAVGTTPHAYITERRLQRARALLRSSAHPVAAIAADCGFAHQSHLGAALKARLGLSPRQYRALHDRA